MVSLSLGERLASAVIVSGLVWYTTGRGPILNVVRGLLLVRSSLVVLGQMVPEGCAFWIAETRRHFMEAQQKAGCAQ